MISARPMWRPAAQGRRLRLSSTPRCASRCRSRWPSSTSGGGKRHVHRLGRHADGVRHRPGQRPARRLGAAIHRRGLRPRRPAGAGGPARPGPCWRGCWPIPIWRRRRRNRWTGWSSAAPWRRPGAAALSPEDGAATLVAFCACAVAAAARHFPEPPLQWLVTGGGRRNPALMRALAGALEAPVRPGGGGRVERRCAGGAGLRLLGRAGGKRAAADLSGHPLACQPPLPGGRLVGALL